MLDDTKRQVVVEIDPTKKYILYYPQRLPIVEFVRLRNALKEWLQDDNPFFVINGLNNSEVKLVKVD